MLRRSKSRERVKRLNEERQLFYLSFFGFVFSFECLKVCKERVKCAQSCFCSGMEGHGVEEKMAREEGKRLAAK